MKLQDIHIKYKTDKGTNHSYIDLYENIFSPKRTDELRVLEIGVLFGGSLKMWEEYFENSFIYGVEDFSQTDGQGYYGFEPINPELIRSDLRTHVRIKLFEFNCENLTAMRDNLKDLTFDIIIDDGSHALIQQKNNLINYFTFLNQGGIYVCEDIQSDSDAMELKSLFESTFTGKSCKIITLDTSKKSDDRVLICYNS